MVDPDAHPPAEPWPCQHDVAAMAHRAEGQEAAGSASSAGGHACGSASPLLCKGIINLLGTLGEVWPPLPSAPRCISAAWPNLPPSPSPSWVPASCRLPGKPGPHPRQPFLASVWITFSPVLFMRTPLLLPTLRVSSLFSLGGPSRFFIPIIFLSPPCPAPGSARWPRLGSASLFGRGSRWGERPQVGCAAVLPQRPRGTWLCPHLPQLSPWLGH